MGWWQNTQQKAHIDSLEARIASAEEAGYRVVRVYAGKDRAFTRQYMAQRGWTEAAELIHTSSLGIRSLMLEFHKLSADEMLKRCPRCAEGVKVLAQVCRYCGHEFADHRPATQPDRR